MGVKQHGRVAGDSLRLESSLQVPAGLPKRGEASFVSYCGEEDTDPWIKLAASCREKIPRWQSREAVGDARGIVSSPSLEGFEKRLHSHWSGMIQA